MKPFLSGALIWRENQGVSMAQDAHLSVESGSLAMSMVEVEDSLRKTFRTAQGMAITAIDLVQRLKNESRIIENNIFPALKGGVFISKERCFRTFNSSSA